MEIIPAIDIRGGRCVRLYQGDYRLETVFPDTPVGFARKWEALGAPRLHVVDLDGAAAGEPRNWQVVGEIVNAVSAPVELGGGLRTLDTVKKALDMGVDRVVLGTAAIENPALIESACRRYGEAIVVGIDARNGRVSVKGWKVDSAVAAEELAGAMASLGAKRFIFTDISRDGALKGPNFEALAALTRAIALPVIASGGVSSLADLERLDKLGVEGAIIGKAFYTGALDAGEVLRNYQVTSNK